MLRSILLAMVIVSGAIWAAASPAEASFKSPYEKKAPKISELRFFEDRAEASFTAEVLLKGKLRKQSGLIKNERNTVEQSHGKWGKWVGGPFLARSSEGKAFRIGFMEREDEGRCFLLYRREMAFAPENGVRTIYSKEMERVTVASVSCAEAEQLQRQAVIPHFEDYGPLTQRGIEEAHRLAGHFSVSKAFSYNQVPGARLPVDAPTWLPRPEKWPVNLSVETTVDLQVSNQLESIRLNSSEKVVGGMWAVSGASQGSFRATQGRFVREKVEADGRVKVLFWTAPRVLGAINETSLQASYATPEAVRASKAADLFEGIDENGDCYLFDGKTCANLNDNGSKLRSSAAGEYLVISAGESAQTVLEFSGYDINGEFGQNGRVVLTK